MPQQPPWFYASRLAFWSSNQHIYRVYVLPQEVLFLKVGTGPTAGGALWGPDLGAALAGPKIFKQIATNLKQLEEADLPELRRLASSDPDSFATAAGELADLLLEAPPTFYRLAPCEHLGELRFSHSTHGKYRLALFHHEHAKTAYRELPKALGDKIALHAEWSDEQLRLVKKH
jgi:hypothetical protein